MDMVKPDECARHRDDDIQLAADSLPAMGYLVLEYRLVEEYLERREKLRPEHLALAQRACDRGELLLAGALADPVDRALLVWSVDNPSVAEDFVKADPYVRHGLVSEWTIRPWTVAVGG